MKGSVKHRIKEFLNYKNATVNSIHKEIRIPQKTLNNQINGESSVGLDTVVAISGYYDDVSLEWLLTGKGEMLKKDFHTHKSIVVEGSNQNTQIGDNSVGYFGETSSKKKIKEKDMIISENEALKNRNALLETKIEGLNKLIDSHERMIQDKDKIIELLLNKYK